MRSILIILAFLCQSAQGQIINASSPYRVQASGPPVCALLLDSYSGAEAAYSLRKLDCNYAGSAVRIRRSSDNTEQDIGFSGNDLDEAALITFTGNGAGNDGFVVTWYDQSGNGDDAVQATSTKQPQIVDEGAVLEQNSLPTMYFDGTDDYLSVSSITLNVYTSLYVVLRAVNSAKPMFIEHGPDAANNDGFYFYGSTGDPWRFRRDALGQHAASGVSNWVSSGTGAGLALADLQYNGTGAYYLDNSAQANNTISGSAFGNTGATQTLYIFSRAGSAVFADGHLSEFVLYDSDQTANRSNIISNINTYYTIY